jgi:protein-disulfide isomerase
MASRTKQKEEARARRLAEEQARTEQARRRRRIQLLGGVVVIAVAIVAVAIAVSSGGGSAPKIVNATKTINGKKTLVTCQGSTNSGVCNLLSGIPQSGNTLGNPNAKVTVTEFGDLECPICRDFALSSENQLISQYVRTGKAKLVYRSLETATGGGPNPSVFGPQQAAAEAAGLQDKEWYYIEFFYHYQGQEDTGYVNQTYLDKLAKLVPGLSFSRWQSDSRSQTLLSQVNSDEQAATAKGFNSTPTILILGPKGQAQPIVGAPTSFGQLQSAITSVQ